MAATSLAEQLQKLAVPQSSVYTDEKKKPSLLFDPKEAALKDRQTFYEIGISGLNELIALHDGFRVYEDTLFNISSKDFERAVQSAEVNQNLDKTIERFLLQLSPYLLLQSTHKALEWLVNRYHIHQYNQDAIMSLILPYHETKIFVRFIQLMDIKTKGNRWNWLQMLKKSGIPLTKQVLHNQCCSNPATLQFIAKSTLKYVAEFGERSSQLNTVFAFFCSTTIGTIDSAKHISESIINAVLPTVINALDSSIADYRSSSYIIIGYLTSKATMKEVTVNEIVERLFNSEFDLSYDVVLLLNLIYNTQAHINVIPEAIYVNVSLDRMYSLCKNLSKMISQMINVQVFVQKFLSNFLTVIQDNTEYFKMFSQLPEIFIDEVNFRDQQPDKIIKCVLDSYCPHKKEVNSNSANNVDDDDSDFEIIEDNCSDVNIFSWYSSLLKSLDNKYPEIFDKIVTERLQSKNSPSIKQEQLSKLLKFKPAIAHKVGDTCLFENLNHINHTYRIEAIKYISKNFQKMKSENADFLKASLIARLNDDNPDVVSATLTIPTEYLNEILTDEDLTNVFVNIVARDLRHYKKWKPVINDAVVKFCSLNALPVSQETILTVMPHLFPYNEISALVTRNIINSLWGKKFCLTKDLTNESIAEGDHELLCETIYNALCIEKKHEFDGILNAEKLNKNSTVDVCFYLLLKSCTFHKASIDELTNILQLAMNTVENRQIIESSQVEFTSDTLSELVNFAKQDKILFEFIEFIFRRIIEDMSVSEITKPWCNVCKSANTILVRKLYEICITGCFIPTYSIKYAKLLQSLFNKVSNSIKDRFEFVANFACGHILFAPNPEDVIGPELQIRSLKLMSAYFKAQKDINWVHDSEPIVIMILFNLNNPLAAIREISIHIIEDILPAKIDKSHTYLFLLKELLERKQELLLDHEQLPIILTNILTQTDPTKKIFKRNCLLRLMGLLYSDIPAHISSEFLNILTVNNSNVFSHVVSSLIHVEKTLKNDSSLNLILDVYESKLVRQVFKRINPTTVSVFEHDTAWNTLSVLLKEFRECLVADDQTLVCPSVLVMKQIEEEVFNEFPDKRSAELVNLICEAGAFGNNPNISSAAAKTFKKIHLNLKHFKLIFDRMLTADDPGANQKKKKNISMLTYQLAETKEWKQGVTLLEYVQNKKKMTVDNKFVSVLFQVLNRCLRFEEQSFVEYTKQLILSSLWFYCKKFVDDTDKEQINNLKSAFDIELIVQCIRNTQNPQTHHHALILLSHAAYMLPEQVLHHTMEIFTFMGTSVLRHDDAYSFQIIVKIIETLIPILVKIDRDIEEYSKKELKQLQGRVVPILRIFADVVLHVPEHRRLPLYKKLIETLGPRQFLWTFLALVLETHVAHFNEAKEKEKRPNRSLADQEAPTTPADFGQSFLLEFEPEIDFNNFVQLMDYIKSLPLQKDENSMDTDVNPSEIFCVNSHSAVQLRHFKYVIITFINTCLSSPRFIHHVGQSTDTANLETQYKSFIINTLSFIQDISKVTDEKTAKYWRVMLHHSYDLLDNTNNLLSVNMFLSVVRGLLKHTLQTVRRKAMELLNSKIQFAPEFFLDCNKDLLFSIIPALLDIVNTIEDNSTSTLDINDQEIELNQQTALLSLKLLTRMLASENPEQFKPVLECITGYTCNQNISGNVMASVVLCLAELCTNLKAHALGSLRKFMPSLIKVLKKQHEAETPELVLLSTVTAVAKIVESLPLFLSPYLQKILLEYSVLLAKWESFDQDCPKVTAIVSKLAHIRKKIAQCIPPRVLIPVANETHKGLLVKGNFQAIGPVMAILAECFNNVTAADFTALQQDLTSFFLTALQLRSDAVENDVDSAVIDKAEDEIINALVCLVLKLSESNFRPFYFKVYDWAIRSNVEGHKERTITFYRLSSSIAEKLKGLFVLFAGHFIKNAAELLDACNLSKSEELYFEIDVKNIALVNSILKTLHLVFLYDSQNFLNKERFESLMQPIVDQLENTLGGVMALRSRAIEVLIPCISQFAVATADDSLWKLLNYQVLLKTRHNDAEIRLTALDCLVSMATQLGSSWLPLLAESVPFLAELLEDGDPRIENSTKDAIRKLEQILGEPLEKYF